MSEKNDFDSNRSRSKNIFTISRNLMRRYDLLLLGLTVAILFIYPKLWQNLFSTGTFMSHGMCYFWIPELVLLHLLSDSLIGLSYVAISLTLAILVYKTRRDIPFQWIFIAFGLFIVACGMTHFMEVWTIWNPTFWFSGYVKLITAVASVATAVILPPLIPKTIELIQSAKQAVSQRLELERTNRTLEKEIAERKKIEEELRIIDRSLNEAQQIARLGSWELNAASDKRIWSKELYRIFGLDPQEFVPTHESILNYIHPDDRENIDRMFKKTLENKVPLNYDFRFIRPDGEEHFAHTSGEAIFDDNGNFVKLIGTVQDITGRIRAFNEIKVLNEALEERTVQLEATNKELEAFSYSVSHDLRAPLRAIDGFSQALLEDYSDKLDDEGRNYLQIVRTRTQNMAQLIDDLLQLSRLSRTETRSGKVNMSALAGKIADELQNSQPARKVLIKIEDNLIVKGDERLIGLALENLLGNAWKFTSKVSGAEITFGKEIIDGENIFFVRDNGAGFDMQFVDKMFGAFQRLHTTNEFGGTGIGLAIVQRVINRHGGKIWAHGEPDKGATFYFTF
jgi:PAS domain S-box-containing protein